MSIPLDRLYHYIESVAQDIRGGNVLIYHFYPHGSKNLKDLIPMQMKLYRSWNRIFLPHIYCYDQEPLNYEYYQRTRELSDSEYFLKYSMTQTDNIRHGIFNIYDKCILLHSELNSLDVTLYESNGFIPVYYWSHALIALDWFRYAQHQSQSKNINKRFLIYNRAWSGTREYRLKFIDLLIKHNLISDCQTSCNSVEPDLQIHYSQHQYINPIWAPDYRLEDYVLPTTATSCSSADFNLEDYVQTEFEVVLETLFDDPRIQLTEKVLRPIACGQPFLLLSTAGSLAYLKRYGFKTFSEIINENYDTIDNAQARMQAVIDTMSTIANWTNKERKNNMIKIKEITEYNQQHFFSNNFFNTVVNELKENFNKGLIELEETNTAGVFLSTRKNIAEDPTGRYLLTHDSERRTRQDLVKVLTKAREYYNRYLKTLNK